MRTNVDNCAGITLLKQNESRNSEWVDGWMSGWVDTNGKVSSLTIPLQQNKSKSRSRKVGTIFEDNDETHLSLKLLIRLRVSSAVEVGSVTVQPFQNFRRVNDI